MNPLTKKEFKVTKELPADHPAHGYKRVPFVSIGGEIVADSPVILERVVKEVEILFHHHHHHHHSLLLPASQARPPNLAIPQHSNLNMEKYSQLTSAGAISAKSAKEQTQNPEP